MVTGRIVVVVRRRRGRGPLGPPPAHLAGCPLSCLTGYKRPIADISKRPSPIRSDGQCVTRLNRTTWSVVKHPARVSVPEVWQWPLSTHCGHKRPKTHSNLRSRTARPYPSRAQRFRCPGCTPANRQLCSLSTHSIGVPATGFAPSTANLRSIRHLERWWVQVPTQLNGASRNPKDPEHGAVRHIQTRQR